VNQPVLTVIIDPTVFDAQIDPWHGLGSEPCHDLTIGFEHNQTVRFSLEIGNDFTAPAIHWNKLPPLADSTCGLVYFGSASGFDLILSGAGCVTVSLDPVHHFLDLSTFLSMTSCACSTLSWKNLPSVAGKTEDLSKRCCHLIQKI